MNIAVPQMHPEAEAAAPDFVEPVHETVYEPVYEEPGADGGPESPYRSVVGGFLIAAAVLWIGVVAWAAGQASNAAPLGAVDLVRWAATASGPLALIGLGWLLFGRSERGETTRFIRGVQQMRGESEALQGVLASIGTQIVANRAALAEESARLTHLGVEAAERLSAVTRDVDAGARAMLRYADQLDRAAGSARTDMGVLLADIPKAEAQARAMAETLRAAGVDAHGQASALEAQMNVLTLRARETGEAAEGATERLIAHVAQMENATQTVTADMERASAAFERVGAETSHGLSIGLGEVEEQIGRLTAQIAAQEEAARIAAGTIDGSLSGMEARLPALTADGEQRLNALELTLGRVQSLLEGVLQAMSGGDARIGELTARGETLRSVLAEIDGNLHQSLPEGLADIEARTERGRVATEALLPQVAALGQATDEARERLDAAAEAAMARLDDAGRTAEARLGEAEALVARQGEAIDALLGKLDGELGAARERVSALGGAVAETDASAGQLLRDTAPQLIEALLRVREAALQATERARDAISTAIPDAAARLGEATGAAMQNAITEQVSTQMAELSALTENAVEAARSASERLTRQMLAIGETAAAVESHIHEAQETLRENDSEQFSRRVAVLIESLNSTAIDVTKILSNDVTDAAWTQYLKGDRGVFTRRAVRLLDAGEAREIVRHYEEEPEFREQVNRYIHDFEALLRRVLGERDGSPLGVTLLSSDVGKLYVALAQAIERIRG